MLSLQNAEAWVFLHMYSYDMSPFQFQLSMEKNSGQSTNKTVWTISFSADLRKYANKMTD